MDDRPETLCEGRWLRLVRRGRWEYAERTNVGTAVVIVAVTPARALLFVEQFRVPLGAATIELPAGLVGDEGEDDSPEAAARRELLEETGWRAADVALLAHGPTTPGMSNEHVAYVRATGLTRVHAGGGTADEDITVHEVPLPDAPAWLRAKMDAGVAVDAKVWAGLWFACERGTSNE